MNFDQIYYKGKPVERDLTSGITLLYPNDTSVVMRGDPEIIKQLVQAIDGTEITYTEKQHGSRS